MNKRYLVRIISLVLYIALIIFFTIKCFENGDTSTSTSRSVAKIIKNILNTIFRTNIEMTDGYLKIIRKLIGHFLYFLVLGVVSLIFYLTFEKRRNLNIIIHYTIGLLFALASEFIFEANTSGRNASFNDVIIDYMGFISLSSIMLIIYIFHSKKEIQ